MNFVELMRKVTFFTLSENKRTKKKRREKPLKTSPFCSISHGIYMMGTTLSNSSFHSNNFCGKMRHKHSESEKNEAREREREGVQRANEWNEMK